MESLMGTDLCLSLDSGFNARTMKIPLHEQCAF
jgi:hypothetical protein